MQGPEAGSHALTHTRGTRVASSVE
jgi:hypothetical protein